MNLDDLPDHEIERLYEAGCVSDDEIMELAQARLSPDELAILDGIAYGIAKILHTPINDLVADASAHRAAIGASPDHLSHLDQIVALHENFWGAQAQQHPTHAMREFLRHHWDTWLTAWWTTRTYLDTDQGLKMLRSLLARGQRMGIEVPGVVIEPTAADLRAAVVHEASQGLSALRALAAHEGLPLPDLGLKVSGAASSAYNPRMMSAHAGLDHGGADTIARYRNVALHAVMGAQHDNPSPAYGYLRIGQGQHIYLFPAIHDAQTWFEQRDHAGGFDYVAVFDAANLSGPVAEDLGAESSPQVGCDPTQVGHWFLPLALGLPLGAAGGYAYRGWRENSPGKIVPWISGDYTPWGAHIIGAENSDVARRRVWPRTKALIQSVIREVHAAEADPSMSHLTDWSPTAYVWSLESVGGSHVAPFASHEEALAYMRERMQGDHVALALFDKASPHWPNPVNWTKSDDPAHEPVIAEQIARYYPVHTAGVGSYPWYSIVGAAIDVLRRQAKIAADGLPARVIGVARDEGNRWQLKQFHSVDDADDWFGHVTRDLARFTYAAYFDKDDVLYPDPLNEKIGAARTPVISGVFLGADPGSSDIRSPTEVRSPTSTSTEVRSPTSTSTEVRSPTSTSTEVRSPTSTSTDAYTQGNVTVTGGAGNGATVVHIHAPHPDQPVRADYESNLERSRGSAWRAERQMGATNAPRPDMPMPAIVDATNAPRATSPIPDMMHATDAPRAESPIPDMMHALSGDPTVGAWHSIVGGGPWNTIVGTAINVLRRQAQVAAEEMPGRVIGVVRHGDNRWKLKTFRDADTADSWFAHVTREPARFTYAAYFDKDDVMFPHPLNESIGAARAPGTPGSPIPRVVAEG
jgi:hypothetical protein